MITAGIDMGTQSIKVMLYDSEKKESLQTAQEPLDLIAENDGTREQKTQWYDVCLQKCFASLDSKLKMQIAAIGVSGHQHGFVPLDKNCNAVYNVKLWNDTSTTKECKIITDAAGGDDAVIDEVSNLMLSGFTAPKILWLKRNKPDAFSKLHYVMLPHNYLNFLLTGAYNAEAGDASGTAFFNSKTGTWSKKICNIIDEKLFSLLPEIIPCSEPNGFVHAVAAKKFGIPEGAVVSSGGGDNMMGAVGTGCVSDGFLTMSLGTSGTLFGYSQMPLCDPKNGISGFAASVTSGGKQGYLPLLCTMNCTVASEETRALFNCSTAELNCLAEKSPPGSCGVVYLPFFNGERTPNLPHGKASIMGLTAANCSRENIARAAFESAIFAMRGGAEAFAANGFKGRQIRIIGGGSKSKLWRQIAADIMNMPVKQPLISESAALGGALQALWCMEIKNGNTAATIESICAEHVKISKDDDVLPNAKNVDIYNESYNLYNTYLNALKDIYK
ncbi:MAG: xylulokinase [Termitinemataceae bacterium]|nr:MAG: xylulokinase [Termitinemataceae bacterium]